MTTRCFFAFLLSCSFCLGADWAQWRGPHFNGSSSATGLPVSWSRTNNVAWCAPLPGQAGSTPVIGGDFLFLTSPGADKQLLLICIERRSGKIAWEREVGSGNRDKGRNNMASPSPVTGDRMVFALFATGDLAAFDFSGNRLWSRQLAADYGAFSHMWIYGASPVLWQNKLYIQVLQRSPVPRDYAHAQEGKAERDSFLLCLDPATGKDLWRHVRITDAINESMESYATPIPSRLGGVSQLLVFGANYLTAHDPASGKELWRSVSINPQGESWWRVVPSPIVAGEFAIICGPKRDPVYAIRPGQSTPVAWQFKEFPSDCVTPLFYEQRLYVLDGDRQMMTCLEPSTGRKLWQGNLGLRDIFRASPTGADDKIYCVSENGNTVVLKAGSEFQILATNALGEGPVRSSIPVENGRLYIRTARNLWCVGR